MNLIERIHKDGSSHDHTHDGTTHSHNAPFWVRHYDKIVGLVTMGRANKIHRDTLSLVNLQAGDVVLDAGCGTGKLILEAEKNVGHLGTAVGLDVEPAMIAQAKQKASKTGSHATFAVASIDDIPYPDNHFDVVFNSLVYHHLNETQKREGFKEVLRVLKPNGRLIVVDLNPTRRTLATSLPGHNQLAQEDHVRHEAAEQMKQVGFSKVKVGTHPYKQLSYAIGEKA